MNKKKPEGYNSHGNNLFNNLWITITGHGIESRLT